MRLSFALAAWVELGGKYPEARRALESVRDAKTAVLLAGPRCRDLFRDVEAINECLGASNRTYELFRRLLEIDAGFAASCSRIAMSAIVGARDFALAARFMSEPEARVRAASRLLHEDVRRLRDPSAATRSLDQKLEAHARVYADEVRMIVAVLAGIGQETEAASIRELAIHCVEDPVRELVATC